VWFETLLWFWRNREEYPYRLNRIYASLGTSKQNFHQQLDRWLDAKEEQAALIPLMHEIRHDHPKMSSREMYKKLKPETMGRDKFEAFCFSQGLKVTHPRNFRKTTDSSGVERFPNLIEGRELTHVNQVLVGDITYYEMNGQFYYLTFIMDLYNREIVGFSESNSLRTTATIMPAMKMVIRQIGRENLDGIIFHTDGGGQFYAKAFLELSSELKMQNSMAKEVYDNSYAERINGTIKNDYLIPYNPQNDAALRRELTRAVMNYNTDRPHSSLQGNTPAEYRKNNAGKAMFIKKITTTIKVENISPGCCPASTAQPNYEVNRCPF
jgi:putative transposase